MRQTTLRRCGGLLLALPFVIQAGTACSGSESLPSAPLPAQLVVSIVTTGTGIDPDGYVLQVDSLPPRAVQANDEVVLDLVAGKHTISLTGLAPNCRASGSDWVRFLGAGERSELAISVACPGAGVLRITTRTTGSDIDSDGYLITIDRAPQVVPVNGEVEIEAIVPGTYFLALRGVSGNCSSPSQVANPREITEGARIDVVFQVECRPRVVYPPGEYLIVARRPLPSPFVAASLDLDLYLLDANGTQLEQLTDHPYDDLAPEFSPDGTRVLFLRFGPAEFVIPQVMLLELGTRSERPQPHHSISPVTWSPDGERYLITLNRVLYSARVNGSASDLLRIITQSVREAFWSPDGSQIAFTGDFGNQVRAYLVKPDGSDLRPLGQNGEFVPGAWSPSGVTMLTLRRTSATCPYWYYYYGYPCPPLYELGVFTLQTSTFASLFNSQGLDIRARWSMDGQRVLYPSGGDIYSVAATGSLPVNVTRSAANEENVAVGRVR